MQSHLAYRGNGRLTIILLLILLAAALFIPHPAWNVMLVILGGTIFLSALWVWSLRRGLSAERHLRSNWVAVGDVLVEQFEIKNRSHFPATWIQIEVESNVVGYRPAFVVNVGRRTQERWRQASICTRRGRYQLGGWTLRFGDPFGLFEGSFTFSFNREIVIHPPVLPSVAVPLPLGQADGRHRRRFTLPKPSLNVATIRDYAPSDPFHHIHWRSTARRSQLTVRQFDSEEGGDLWLLLDQDRSMQLGEGSQTIEEQAVLLAASLLAQTLAQGRGAGLAAYGRNPHIIHPQRGESQRWRLLEALAMAEANHDMPLQTALADFQRVARSGTAVLILTANPTLRWLPALLQLQRLGLRLSVVLFERSAYGGTHSMTQVMTAVQRRGMPCVLLQPEDILDKDVSISPFRKELGRV